MNTECITEPIKFHPHNKQEVIGKFDGGRITSDGGSFLLREIEQHTGVIKQFAKCFRHRNIFIKTAPQNVGNLKMTS